MLLSHFEWLCIILPTLIAASPQDSLPTATIDTLPAKLQRDVPLCAQPCLLSSIGQQFPLACTLPPDLSCLCSRYSFGGESLGEVALGCIYAACSTIDRTAASAYNICLGEPNAVRPTLSVLTVVPSFSASSTMVTTHPGTTQHSSTIATTSRPTSADTVAVDSISVTVSSTSSVSQQTSTPVAAADPPKTMKPGQIAGLSVAAAATFVIAIGLMALSVYLRRKRERKNGEYFDEKMVQSPSPGPYSPSFLDYGPHDSLPQEPPSHFLAVPRPVLQKTGRSSSVSPAQEFTLGQPPKRIDSKVNSDPTQLEALPIHMNSIHPLLRPTPGTSNNSSDSAVPLEQIGLAISAEEPERPTKPRNSTAARLKSDPRQQRPKSLRRDPSNSKRPDSVLTQSTVFEEDDVAERRRESKLLPTPPFPIPPIRSFQPSRPPLPMANVAANVEKAPTIRKQTTRQPELFLDIPVRLSRSEPRRLAPIQQSHLDPPIPASLPKPQPAPRVQNSSAGNGTQPVSSTTSITEASNGVDIDDYYFMTYQDPTPKSITPTSSPNRLQHPRESPKLAKIKPKISSSTVSRSASKASTNIRDSISSQTSFETADPNDPTPEAEEEEKQLAEDNKLSPVAESPISNLRYPKVPRASNQLVPRSPRSPQSLRSQESPRRLVDPSGFLFDGRGEREPPFAGNQMLTGSPNPADVRQHIRQYRRHLRSTSLETWNTNSSSYRSSERTTRVLSGQWQKPPAMYEPHIVAPLNIRTRQQQGQSVEMEALKSPAWVPRLYPTRQGDDLLISVTYSKPGH